MSKLNDIFWNLSKKAKTPNKQHLLMICLMFEILARQMQKSHLSINSNLKDDDENIIWFVNDLFLISIQKWASDIHIEPNEKNIRTRLRIDWNFVEYKIVDLKIRIFNSKN